MLENPNTAQPSFIADRAENYTVELIVNDGKSDSNPDTVVISTQNSKPVANAGPDQMVSVGAIVQLDGSGSTDADGDSLGYFWSFTSKPQGSAANISDPTRVNPTFVADLAGLYVVQLIVSDGKLDSDPNTASITVEVVAPVNHPPIANNDSVTTSINTPVVITVLGNDSDPDNDPILVTAVTQGANGSVTHTSATVNYTPNAAFHGIDNFTYTISDGRGGSAIATVTVTVDQPPQVNAGSDQTITFPSSAILSGTVIDDGLPNPPGLVTISWTKVSGPGTVTFANANAMSTTATFSQAGTYVLRITGDDGFLSSSDDVQVTVNTGTGGGLPPDPSTVAPPIDPSVATTIDKSTEFLYSGPNPIQTGVPQGTINPVRAAVIRGKVVDRNNGPLSGVTITILNHPELGQTLSRADGMFDMAVNGGGYLTVTYQKTGFLSAQRQINVPWQDFARAPDVVLITVDSQVSTIAANATVMQTHRGNTITDSDGTRQATLLFPAGTTAAMIMPDGSAQAVTSLNVRATEYTIGPNGPAAMPAPLPPSSGYTYAVELSADEAIAAGATEVRLNQPIFHYVENFLGFPVGMAVPAGFYDRTKAAWVPSENGRVIKIIGISAGLANVDTVGSQSLPLLTLSDAERQQLAILYSVGQELWRVPITHFTPWDCNWPYGPPPDAKPPPPPPAIRPPSKDPCLSAGSIISCESQTLGEALDITGTPFQLHYSSDRVPGRKVAYTLDIPLSGATIPPSLLRIDLEINVTGRQFKQSFSATLNQSTFFTWDGIDAYGRPVQGAAGQVRVGYTYVAVYQTPAQLVQSFGAISGIPISAIRARGEITLWQESNIVLGTLLNNQVGGWSLSPHHVYDVVGKTLFLGDGTRRDAQAISAAVITTVAGNGIQGFSGDGGPATQASLAIPSGVAVAPDGSLYIAESGNNRIRRVGPDGIITTAAGNGIQGFSGDGGPATQASLGGPTGPTGVALAPDGSLYIADWSNNRIRRVGPDGIITTVAGNGIQGFNGDGGPATQAGFTPQGVAVAPDGSLYIADYVNHRIRRVGPDGIITTVAGNGIQGFSGDGGPATQASLGPPAGVVVAADGSLYIADAVNNRIRRLRSALPSLGIGDIYIPSEDGAAIYVFTGGGRQQRTLNALTGSVRYEFGYDSAGRLSQVSEKTGGSDNVTTIQRDSNGNPTKIISPFGQETLLTVDTNGYLASITNPANESVQVTYSSDGLLQTFTNARGKTSQYTYDSSGLLVRATDASGGFQSFARSTIPNGYTVTRTTSLGRTTLYKIEHLSTGDDKRTNTFPGGEVSQILIKTDGTEILTQTDGTAITTVAGPDPRWGMMAPVTKSSTIQTPNGLSPQTSTTVAAVLQNPIDPLSLVSLTRSVTVSGRTTTNSYTAATRTSVTTTPLGRTQTVVLDTLGRPASYQIAGLSTATMTYDTRGRLGNITVGSGATARVTTFTYNAQGYLASTTDPLGRTTQYSYDLAGRVTSTTLPDGRAVNFTYDAAGNMASLTPPSRPAHTFDYSNRNGLTLYTPPSVPGTGPTAYAYDADRALTTVATPDSRTVVIGYDAAGRPITRSLATSGVVTGVDTTSYDAAGRVSAIPAASGVSHGFNYDGLLDTGESWTGALTGSVTRTYDSILRLATEAINGANQIAIAYDNDDLTTGVGALTITRDGQNGLPTATSLGVVTTTHSYNGFGEESRVSSSANGAQIYNVAYTRDNLGRITQKTETIGGITDTYTYAYDLVGRLITVTKNGATIESYSYDGNGNRTSATVNGVNVTATYDPQDRLIQYGSASYTHGPAGDLLSKTVGGQTTSYQYDQIGNLLSASLPGGTTVGYVIDGRDRRVGKKVNGVLAQQFLYGDSLRPVAELDVSGNMVSRFVYANRVNVPDYMVKGGVTYRIITDQVGSVRLVVNNATGAVVQRMDYDSFGNVSQDTNPGFQPFGFAGGLYDRDSNLVRYGARDYDPQNARFLTKDPIGPHQGGGTNPYAYVYNNPVTLTDPMGLDAYLVSRDIYINGTNTEASHNFIAVINDSGTQTFSYGQQPSGQLGLINGRGAGFAGDTAAIDRASLYLGRDTAFQRIDAPDSVVIETARGVIPTERYFFLGPNSNSAAQAVANISQGSAVNTPSSSFFGAVGSGYQNRIVGQCGGR